MLFLLRELRGVRGPHLHIDVTVVSRGLDVTGALLVLTQHCQTKVLDQISELLGGGNPAPVVVVMIVTVISVVLPTIAKNACKAITTIIWRKHISMFVVDISLKH